MSSSATPSPAAIHLVQSGVVLWEDPAPIPDWRYKTVTVVGCSLVVVSALLRELVASRLPWLRRIFRALVAPSPPDSTAMQTRRVLAQLKHDPPGFGATNTKLSHGVCWVVSELHEIDDVDTNFLTDYRHCALIASALDLSAADALNAVASESSEVGGRGLIALLELAEVAAVIRVLEMTSHSVVQVFGASDICDEVVRFLEDRQIRRIHEIHRVSEEIRRICA